MKSAKGLRAIDLFSGCGGMSLGLKQAGFKVIGAVDLDDLAVETYKLNHKKVNVWKKDIKRLSASEVKSKLGIKKGDLDLLAGCPPCQGFSSVRTLNRGALVSDPRNELVYEFLRFAKALLPKAVMMENVPGLFSDSRIEKIKAKLSALGYFVTVDVLDAANYSVPQRRKRMILVGTRLGEVKLAGKARRRKTVREAISHLPRPGRSGDPCHDVVESRSKKILDLIKKIPKNGGSRSALGNKRQLDCHKNCNGFKDVYGRMSWDKVSPTITGGCVNPSKGRFLHPTQNRSITLREAALLQSFPMKYKFSLRNGKFPAAQMIGNALPPEFIKRQALAVKRALSKT